MVACSGEQRDHERRHPGGSCSLDPWPPLRLVAWGLDRMLLDWHPVPITGLQPSPSPPTSLSQGGLSCGVVGRTGSGKSSLLLTLFRLIPVTHGAIRLGGVDTARLALDALRRQIAIIPQDPVLFSGSLRGNLDPWNAFDDHRLWEVLGAVQLGPVVRALGGLEGRMQEAGDNLSVGQRQLFCLARALLQVGVGVGCCVGLEESGLYLGKRRTLLCETRDWVGMHVQDFEGEELLQWCGMSALTACGTRMPRRRIVGGLKVLMPMGVGWLCGSRPRQRQCAGPTKNRSNPFP